MATTQPPKYIAQLKRVRELGLVGSANLDWWQQHLSQEHYEPVEIDGQAQVLLTGLDAKWMGKSFRDISICVTSRSRLNADETGFFIVHARNTGWFLSTVERCWFGLPYQYCKDLQVEVGQSGMIQSGPSSDAGIRAVLDRREESEATTPTEAFRYVGPLFLPKTRTDDQRRRWFMVDLHGETQAYEFDSARDHVEFRPHDSNLAATALHASQFQGTRWHVRMNATHARTKTYVEKT